MELMRVLEHLKEVDNTIKQAFDMPENYYFAGGIFKSLVNDEPVNDYDVFFFEEPNFLTNNSFITDYTKIRNTNQTGFTLESTLNFGNKAIKVQFIKIKWGEPESLIRTFDFLHTQMYYNPNTEETNLTPDKTSFLRRKQLVYVGGHEYPVKSLWRAFKFIGQGWSLEKDQLLRMLLDINSLNLNRNTVLREQTRGLYGNISNLISLNGQTNISQNDEDDMMIEEDEEIETSIPSWEERPISDVIASANRVSQFGAHETQEVSDELEVEAEMARRREEIRRCQSEVSYTYTGEGEFR